MKPKAESMCETKQRVTQDAASRPVIVLLNPIEIACKNCPLEQEGR